MSITGDWTREGKSGLTSDLRRTLRTTASALSAGWRAAIEYRRLSALTEDTLRARGLSRADIRQELQRRYFDAPAMGGPTVCREDVPHRPAGRDAPAARDAIGAATTRARPV